MSPLALLLIQESPALIAAVKDLFTKANPGAPVPTSEEIIRGFEELFSDSLAVDDLILSQHPNA